MLTIPHLLKNCGDRPMTEEKKTPAKKPAAKKKESFLALAEKELATLGKALEKSADKPASETNILKTQFGMLESYIKVTKQIEARSK